MNPETIAFIVGVVVGFFVALLLIHDNENNPTA